MKDDDDKTMRMLLGVAGPDIGCDACFDQLDRYVEAQLAGRDADALVPGMRAHLEGCPACHEEHASLPALLQQRSDADTAPP